MRICVLVVDDEAPIAASIIRAFMSKWSVMAVTDPHEALDVLRSPAEFDAIILDLFMGEIGGVEIYEILEREASARCARVIFHTGGSGHPALVPWLNATGRPVLSKPSDMASIEAVVTRVANIKGPRGPNKANAKVHHEEKHDDIRALIREELDRAEPFRRPEPITENQHHRLASIADDEDDDRAERTGDFGKDIRIPPGSSLEQELNKILEKNAKLAAIEADAGKWAWLRKWWFEWWKRLARGVLFIVAGAAAREVVQLLAFVAKHVH